MNYYETSYPCSGHIEQPVSLSGEIPEVLLAFLQFRQVNTIVLFCFGLFIYVFINNCFIINVLPL